MQFKNSTEKLIFFSIPSFFFSLIPFFLISGPFLSDFAISIISLIFLFYCYKKNDYLFFKKKYVYFFFAFWFYLLLNSLLNNPNFDSIKISLFYFRFGVFVIAILNLIKFDKIILKYFFFSLIFCFLILIFDGFYQYFFDENIIGWKKSGNNRLSSLFGDELILGSYISRLWPLFFSLWFLFYSNHFFKLPFFILLFVLSEVLIFLSGERTAFFYINLSAIFVIIFSNNLKSLRFFTLISSLVILSFVILLNPNAKERMVDQTIKQLEPKNNSSEIIIFSEQHTHHYKSSYKMFLDNKIFGVGVKNFRNFCDDPRYKISNLSCSTHPHNTYLQILTELGLVGLIFTLIPVGYFVFYNILHLIKKFQNKTIFNDFEICLLSGILITLWPFAPTGNFFGNWLNVIYFLYIPFFLWSIESRKFKETITI